MKTIFSLIGIYACFRWFIAPYVNWNVLKGWEGYQTVQQVNAKIEAQYNGSLKPGSSPTPSPTATPKPACDTAALYSALDSNGEIPSNCLKYIKQ